MIKKYFTKEERKEADKEIDRKFYQKHKEEIKQKRRKYYQNNKEKILLKTKEYQESNKEKIKIKKKKYYKSNKKEILIKTKENYQNNNKKRKITQKKYRQSHKKEKLKYNKIYVANKKKNDINFRIACCLRSRTSGAIKNNQKTGSAVRDLGCSVSFLKLYLESIFQPGMSWDNWSRTGWHIDHIKPLIYFDLTNREDFLKACHYTNLQPLWAEENYKKGNKINE